MLGSKRQQVQKGGASRGMSQRRGCRRSEQKDAATYAYHNHMVYAVTPRKVERWHTAREEEYAREEIRLSAPAEEMVAGREEGEELVWEGLEG